MTAKTPRERIQSLLKIHGGHCFIVMCCKDFEALATEAATMAEEGLVTIASDNGGTVAGLDVKKKGYRSQRATPAEFELPSPPWAHRS